MRKNFLSFTLSTSVLLSFPFNKLHDVIMFTYIYVPLKLMSLILYIFSLKNLSCVELYELSYLYLSELQFHFIFVSFSYLSCCVLVFFGTELNNFWCHPEYVIKV